MALFTPVLLITVELRANSDPFLGFFIQARIENNQGSTTSIVGVWTPLNTTMARTATCNGVDGVSYFTQRCTHPFIKAL